MLMLEGQLVASSLPQYTAILGNSLSVEIKVSRKTLMIYEICKHFQLLIYDLPYINLPASGLLSLNSIETAIKNGPKEVKIEIKVEEAYIADAAYELVPTLCKEALLDTVKWYLAEIDSKVPNPYLKKLEAVLLSLMYKRGKLTQAKDFNWHIAMSEVHDTRESFMHEIDTNHLTITNSKTAVRREDGLKVNSKFDDFRPLKYYT